MGSVATLAHRPALHLAQVLSLAIHEGKSKSKSPRESKIPEPPEKLSHDGEPEQSYEHRVREYV